MTNSEKTPDMGVVIGIDYGAARIGVARINTLVKIGEPLQPVTEKDQSSSIEAILNAANDQNADSIVVGLPRGLDGQETQQTNDCREFAEKLQTETKTPVYIIDEAGSSEVAKSRISKKKPQSIDSMAAVVIVEDFVNFKDKQTLKV